MTHRGGARDVAVQHGAAADLLGMPADQRIESHAGDEAGGPEQCMHHKPNELSGGAAAAGGDCADAGEQPVDSAGGRADREPGHGHHEGDLRIVSALWPAWVPLLSGGPLFEPGYLAMRAARTRKRAWSRVMPTRPAMIL